MAMDGAPAFEASHDLSLATCIMEVSHSQQVQEFPDLQMLDPVQEDGEQNESPFGQIHRQRRRQQIPRAPRRCFPSFDAPALRTSPGLDNSQLPQACVFSTNDSVPVSSCSYRAGDEEIAACSTTPLDLKLKNSRFRRSPTDSSVSEDGDSSLSSTSWSSGQLVWAKFSRSPWWPAQVVDDRSAGGAPRDPKLDVLVRFFGNYNYAWVDAATSLSKFDMNFQEKSQIVTKAFQKGLREAMDYRNYRKLPLKWRHASWKNDEFQTTPQANGKDSSEDESERTTSARRRKPKVLYEDEERLHHKPKRNLRRKRIMRELGLAAPYGSPFTNATSV